MTIQHCTNSQGCSTSVWPRIALLVLLLSTGAEVRAAPARCEVVDVSDGDTLTVRCEQNIEQVIRLAGIDGPVHQALFWARAKRNLAAMLLQQNVSVDVVDTDADGEPVAQIYLGSTHVNASVVSEGMARCRPAAAKDDWCTSVESGARAQLRGVWSDPWLTTRAAVSRASMKRRIAT